jgi:Bifunctional DNA primase/polymerase, N-terminal
MTDLSAIPSEVFLPVDGEPLDVRLQMLANGYEPMPLSGKRPLLPGWPQVPINDEAVRASGSLGLNTGVRTARIPILDFDLLDEEAARLVEGIARRHLSDRGKILLRIGLPPKRAIPLRTNAPFKKIVVALISPNSKPGDKPQKIEVLGDGQQIAVAGIHPDTGKPYVWRDGRSPVNTLRDQLPVVDEAEARAIVDECVSALVQHKVGK